ncbi:MAG: NADAR family protein [Lentisphaeria bacterium]|nr:NADAR family protein [Lentisphaeria bacterium]
MKDVFERLLKHCVEVYSGRIGRKGMPYIVHPLALMSAVMPLPEIIVALTHDYGEFRDTGELAELGVPPAMLERIDRLAKHFPDDVPETDPRYCEYIWNLLGDPVCRRIKYYDLLTNDGFEDSPAADGRRRTGEYPRVMNLLGDGVLNGRLYFCSQSLYFDVFSNFYEEPLEIGGELWKSGEHYYQAAKFAEESVCADRQTFHEIRCASTPGEAKLLADTRLRAMSPPSPEDRLKVMETMLRVKFAPGTRMHRRLLQTGELNLIHLSQKDFFWGQNRAGEGQNHLGCLLMRLRGESQMIR